MVREAIRGRGGRFFTIAFKRKTKGKNGEPVGEIRRMVCRRHVRKYVKGVLPIGQRAAEDLRCEVLTVFCIDTFHKLRKEGMPLRKPEQTPTGRLTLRKSWNLHHLRRNWQGDKMGVALVAALILARQEM
ncbi:unnamed protein product [Sphagnum jensenii]|uniref:Uncharacterized protein n=1 Tax=Sphagnum jensenii TaxID=128206 RepID=A0ABP0V9Y8_9BRYO